MGSKCTSRQELGRHIELHRYLSIYIAQNIMAYESRQSRNRTSSRPIQTQEADQPHAQPP